MAFLLLHLVQHVKVPDGCGNNRQDDCQHDQVRVLGQLYGGVDGVLDGGFPQAGGLVAVGADRFSGFVLVVECGCCLEVLENACGVLCEGVRNVQAENKGCG